MRMSYMMSACSYIIKSIREVRGAFNYLRTLHLLSSILIGDFDFFDFYCDSVICHYLIPEFTKYYTLNKVAAK